MLDENGIDDHRIAAAMGQTIGKGNTDTKNVYVVLYVVEVEWRFPYCGEAVSDNYEN